MSFFIKKFIKSSLNITKIPFKSFSQNIKESTENLEKTKNTKHTKSKQSSFKFQSIPYLQKGRKNPWSMNLENKSETDCKLFQGEINRISSLNALNIYYKINKEKMDLVNICTCLDRAVDLSVKNFQFTGTSHPLTKQPEVDDMIKYLSDNINQMNEFAVSNFLSNLVKLGIFDQKLFDKLIQRILQNQHLFTQKALSYIVWGLARANIRNEQFLDMLVKRILVKDHGFPKKSFINTLWSISMLEYEDPALMGVLENLIQKKHKTFDEFEINLVLSTCSHMRMKNNSILDLIIEDIENQINVFSFRTLANIVTHLTNLEYIKKSFFDKLEKELTKRLQLELGNETQEISAEKDQGKHNKENINLLDSAQILVSYCQNRAFSHSLLELLQQYFIQNIENASTGMITSYALANSVILGEMSEKYKQGHQVLLEKIRAIKKFNYLFYEMLIPLQKARKEELSVEEILSMIMHAPQNLTATSSIKKGILYFGILYIPKIAELREKLSKEEFEKLVYKYNNSLLQYGTRKEHLIAISEAFKKIGVEIERVDSSYRKLYPKEEDKEKKEKLGNEINQE